jgi:hypothetical protein
MGFAPDPKQVEVLLAMADPGVKQGILNCTRQWGKSTTAAAGAVFRAVTRPKSLIVVASPSKKQSAELVRKAGELVAVLGIKTGRDGIHPVSLVFPNGSRIIGLPMNAATVRGLSAVSLLLIDEASRVSEELYHAVSPMVAVARGDVWLMSTPWGASGFFYDAWMHGGPTWARFCVKATECPRIPLDWLETKRSQMEGSAFRREFMAEFVQDDLSAFNEELIEAAVDRSIEPMQADWLAWRRARGEQGGLQSVGPAARY